MTTFNSTKQNVFHYLTFVTFMRVPIFKSDDICRFFIESLKETNETLPFKLVAYVIMPDHVHLIINPVGCDIKAVGKMIKGKCAKKVLDWLKANSYFESLNKLRRVTPHKRNHSFSVCQKSIKSIDLESQRFVLQKSNYVHMNPVRARFCDHPAKWKWSSFRAYLPHEPGETPVEIDLNGFWKFDAGDGQRPWA